ncbi:filamentous hemagglutinin N-terminal domain-containing protein [Pantoea sp. Bo_7]|uniref:hemagglutinin repeat-containing protein n=1 Tax=unclassified Pantoea TaxID=2630326 RepID=UPI0012322034|nr:MULTISPECIES: hemagglutinin repeat-containing protein [unclassified Pantoea]KAA6043346.1 filamentous hemagglutinin N-terminal domain-containing protein [Pantoea sp. Bo_7]KAA6088215.1 filamentous hemagglutinin N-terminal domain-containing protein [Pantoea sp. Bo_10]
MDDRQPVSLARRVLSYLICSLVAMQPVLPAVAAQITPVTPGTQMDKAGNGVPVVNIATPNGAGISHNQYQQYNVGQEGVILNNATGQLNRTQLGGLIQNNPHLKAGHEAQAIINEVTGASRSQLRGYTEVAGKAANVMVANPYGITCNGCGFINTPNVTLTTGKPQLDVSGKLSALEVTKGSVIVEGKGLDGSSADAVAIVARATEINAGIYAKDLSVTVGANRVGADGSVTPIAGEGPAPSVAVDTGALGGMYANRIHLVSGEKGVGINLGNLAAKQGDIRLDTNGKLTLSNSLSSGALTASGASVALNGDNKATGQITVSAQQDATLGQGTLVSDAGIAVTAKGHLTSNGTTLTAGGDIRLKGSTLTANQSTRANAARNIQLQAQNQISNSGQFTAADSLTADTRQLDNSGALAASAIKVKADSLQNHKEASVAATRSLIAVSDRLLNQGVLSAPALNISSAQTENSGLLQGTGALSFSGDSLNNLNGGTLSSDNAFSLNLPTLNNSGLISSGTTLTLSGQRLTNSGEINAGNLTALNNTILNNADGSLLAGKTLQLNNQELTNSGKLAALRLTLNSDAINNSGTLQAKEMLQTESQQFTNSGSVLSEDQLMLDTAALSNAGSLQGQRLNVNADRWLNSGKALSLAEGTLTTGSLTNTGTIFGQQALDVNSGETINNGLLQGTTALRFSGQRLTNQAKGIVSSDNSFGLDLPELNNAGLISSGAALTLSGGSLINAGEISAASLTADNGSVSNQQGGVLLADNAMQLNSGTLFNAGQIAASQLDISSTTAGNSGLLQGKETLQATGEQLTNSGTVLSGGQLTLKQDRLDNRGQMQGQQLDLRAGDWQNSGSALSEGDATIAASTLANSGKIVGQQHIEITGNADNSGWLLAQALTLKGDLVNGGLIQGTDALALQGATLVNQENGQLLTAGKAEIRGSALNNQGSIQADQLDLKLENWQNAGSSRAASQLSASVNGVLDNSGTLISEQALNLLSSELSNGGTLAADRLDITSPQLTNSGLLQGNSALSLSSANVTNIATGKLITGDSLSFAPVTLTNAGLLQVAGDLSLTGQRVTNKGRITATNLSAMLDGSLDNDADGLLLAQQQAVIQANTLNNAGTIAAQQVKTAGVKLQNQGLLQGDSLLTTEFSQFDNLLHGQLISGDALSLRGGAASNAGVWQGQHLGYHFTSLSTRGTINGIASLSGTTDTLLDNSGSLLSGGHASVTAGSLTNSGKVMADSLTLRGDTLTNQGLWQGATGLDAQAADHLQQSAGGQALTGGVLLLSADTLETAGTLQGQRAQVSAGRWQHQGSLLSSADLTASVSGDLNNQGDLLSQGAAQIDAQNLINSGRLLAEHAVTLRGGSLNNSGTVQGDTLAIYPANVTNQGSLIGLQSLTLGPAPAPASRLRLFAAQAQPARVLMNSAGGQLLTQGTLHISGDAVTNNGIWQGQQILLDANSLANGGAIQSGGDLQLNLGDTLTSAAGSKITANGSAALTALSFTNQGQWIARNLTLQGTALNNSGEISGAEGLTTTLSGTLTQQQNAALLSSGTLDVHATSLDNAGRMQGRDLLLSSGSITNSGHIQGDSSLQLNASGRLINNASGTFLSQNSLTLTAPELYNYGVIQGATSRITTSGLASNSGKLLSSADLTLNVPQLVNSGWLQASQLMLNAASASNSGTLMADQQAILTGSSLQNQGSAQGANLTVNYAQLTNSGTLLGTNQLNINAAQVTQQAAGKLFSGGSLLLESTGFDQLGQVVALGDATLKLINSFTAHNTLAAGNRLTISSKGAIDNQGTLQGQALTLSADGDLINNGQLTTGSGDSSLSGQRITMNSAGTLQGGGNIALNSRSDVALSGFTGTRGSLTLSSPGSIVNTALLYAGQNLYLYADRIQNQRGDILAGNNLWMQRDAAGNANSEIINTSGNIESQQGDITLQTAHLLNQWESISVGPVTTENVANSYASETPGTVEIPLDAFQPGELKYYFTDHPIPPGPNFRIFDVTPIPTDLSKSHEALVARTTSSTQVSGQAGRIAAGHNLNGQATTLDNLGSYILAGGNLSLTGQTLNNQSYLSGTQSVWRTYTPSDVYNKYKPVLESGGSSQYLRDNLDDLIYKGDAIYFHDYNTGVMLKKSVTYVATENYRTEGSTSIRGVIQANGNVSANFAAIVNNSESNDVRGTITPTLAAPAIAGLANAGIGNGSQRLGLEQASAFTVGSPEWVDEVFRAVQTVNGAGSLVSPDTTTRGLNIITDKTVALQTGGQKIAMVQSAEGAFIPQPGRLPEGQKVDISAWPIPLTQNGYFTVSQDPASPYLITVNPKLNGLGALDQSLFSDLNTLLHRQPSAAPAETRGIYTDTRQFLGSSYLLDRLQLKPEQDYRFLGDAAFDTRYVSNALLSQTGNRYINGMGSDLQQMSWLMDNAAKAQQSLGLAFGVSLNADQIAALDHSILWWEQATINGQTVMVPKLYLSPDDATVANGSVIAGNNVALTADNIRNNGSTISAKQNVALTSQAQIDNINSSLIKAGEGVNLSALGNINNIGSTISGRQVALESVSGNIVNLTSTASINNNSIWSRYALTEQGNQAAIISTGNLSLVAGDSVLNTASLLKANDDLKIQAVNDVWLGANTVNSSFTNRYRDNATTAAVGSTLSAGSALTINAGKNLSVVSGQLNSGKDMSLTAGNDLALSSQQSGTHDYIRNTESHRSGAERTTVSSGGKLTLVAGQDITSQATALVAEDDIGLKAGRDINLNAEEFRSGNSERGSRKTIVNETVRQQGSEIVSGGSTTLLAGNDITSQASTLTANKDLALQAGHDVNITTVTESDYAYREETKTRKKHFSKKTTHTLSEESATAEKASSLSGDRVSIIAGNDLLVKGSSVVGESDVGLKAGNDLNITAATDTQTRYRLSETKKSGMFSGGGIGVTFGSASSKQELKQNGTTESQSASTIGSTGGNVTMVAGQNARVAGSDVIAKQDISLAGGSVTIDPGYDTLTRRQSFEQKQSGLTLQLTSPITDALLSLGSQAKAAGEAGDDRLKALNAVKMLESGWAMSKGATQSATALANGNVREAGIKIALNVGASKSKFSSEYNTNVVSGSSLNGGGKVAVVATGAKGTSGDLILAGSNITGGNVTLAAAHDLNLVAASNNTEQKSSNNASGWSAGVHVAIGQKTGIGVQASGYMASGAENGSSTTYVNSRVNAKENLTLSSGNDTLLSGAQALGNSISVNAGNNLTLSSLQDTDNYQSKQQSASGGFSFTFGTMNGSFGLSLSQTKVNSEYASVGDQSGLFAGNGGYDIFAGHHTQLNGAVIASTADAADNRLSTGTLGWDNIENHAEYHASSTSVGISGGNDGTKPSLLPTLVNMSGSASGTTRSAVADGTLVIRDKAQQIQDVSGLSHDTDNANGHIDKIFDKEKVGNQLAFAQGVQELAGKVVGDVKAYKLDAAAEETKARLLKEHPDYAGKSSDEMNTLIEHDPGYKAVADKWSTGGTYSMVATAVASALGGLSANNPGAAASGAMAPFIANQIKKATTTYDADGKEHIDLLANTMAHAVAAGVLARMGGGDSTGAAAGAAGGELTAQAIIKVMYPDTRPGELTESQKQTISTLSQLAGGFAGGIASDSLMGSGAGTMAGKNAVENNSLAVIARGGQLAVEGCLKLTACRNQLIESGLGALIGASAATSAVEQLSFTEKTNVMLAAMSADPALVEKLSSAERKAYDELQQQKGLITVLPVPEQDPAGGKLVNPVQDMNSGTSLTSPDQRDQNGVSHTGNNESTPNTGGNITVTPLPEEPTRDDLAYLALKGKEAQEAAGKLGFDRKIPAQKSPFNSHGQPVFYDGKNYITPDVDSHNVTNGWKMFNKKGKRIGTYDSELNRIKD